MNNLLAYVFIVFPIAVIVAVALVLHNTNKSEQTEASESSKTSAYKQPTFSTSTAFNSSDDVNYKNYAMTEPFAANAPTDFTPEAWMQMMNNMMNLMQMTQMMHQMAAMPMQMMNLAWMNPYGLSPGYNASPVQPMDPAEYKKWYEQQQEAMKMDKK